MRLCFQVQTTSGCRTRNSTALLFNCVRFSQAQGKIAAADNAGRFDLCGLLAWDLMHINGNGFTSRHAGGGISGLVDPFSFFSHPLSAVDGIDESITLEDTLDKFVATQYLEVSTGTRHSYMFNLRKKKIQSRPNLFSSLAIESLIRLYQSPQTLFCEMYSVFSHISLLVSDIQS